MYFRFQAECITRQQAKKLVDDLGQKYGVEVGLMDPTFTNNIIVIVKCTVPESLIIQKLIWAVNGGAECTIDTITPDQLEEYL